MSSIISLNVRGLKTCSSRTKIDQINHLSIEYNACIIALSETWLTDSHLDAEISIPEFSVFRSDRKNRKYGGVCLYVKTYISAVLNSAYCDDTIE